jgi:CubicO group peptidase (beta-lactamase class C family)
VIAALDGILGWPAPDAAAGVVALPPDDRAPPVELDVRGDGRRVGPWASVTKLLVALVVLVAVEEGSVDLDEAAGPPGSTVRHLLAHASGLGPEGRDPLTTPGRRRIYSNAGFEVLAEVVADRTAMSFGQYLVDGVLRPLGMAGTTLPGGASPASGARGPLVDMLALAAELLAPTLVAPSTLASASKVAFPGLAGVLPGFGRFDPCDWGLGFECRDGKSPHWTGSANSPRTFGHFGQSGAFVWVDPDAGLAMAVRSGRDFAPWARSAWPDLADGVLAEVGGRRVHPPIGTRLPGGDRPIA